MFATVHLLACARLPDPLQKDALAAEPPIRPNADHVPSPPARELSEQEVRNESPPEAVSPPPVTETYAWKEKVDPSETLLARVPPPSGFQRVPLAEDSFGAWLRTLPVKAGRPDVMLHDGRRKANQSAHALVIDIDTGSGDLQQCADAVMRLRAEFLYAHDRYQDIHFNFTTGDRASYDKWRLGYRPAVKGNDVSWALTAAGDTTYAGFRKYLTSVFTYAGTASLSREMKTRPLDELEAGDVFIIGGFPGHAVLVLDVAEDSRHEQKVFLLAQSYMPAQDMHVLVNPDDSNLSPWYSAGFGDVLVTPEWTFKADQLRRFVP